MDNSSPTTNDNNEISNNEMGFFYRMYRSVRNAVNNNDTLRVNRTYVIQDYICLDRYAISSVKSKRIFIVPEVTT